MQLRSEFNGSPVFTLNNLEIKVCKIPDNAKFIILASDGVWEFMSSRKVTEIIEKYYRKGDIEGACDCILNMSLKKWCQQDDNIDDISMILIFVGQ